MNITIECPSCKEENNLNLAHHDFDINGTHDPEIEFQFRCKCGNRYAVVYGIIRKEEVDE